MAHSTLAVCIKASKVSYSVTTGCCGRKQQTKNILNNIDLYAAAGELVAIIGPSGSGKTTLLNAIAGRLSTGSLSGSITFNGIPLLKDIKRISNYVMQQDHLLPFLTVEETLLLAAKLRMNTATNAHRKQQVEKLLHKLRLNSCRKTLVGGPNKKGISGGQMKRLAIAMELVENPPILFLDEPTSGLDSSLSYDILRLLIDLAHDGKTILCTIHQPRSQVFHMFDKLVVLSNGYVVYQGEAKEAAPYFNTIGYPCPLQFNPADFILDLLTVKNSQNEKTTSRSQKRLYIPPEETALFPDKFASSEYAMAFETRSSTINDAGNETLAEIRQYVSKKSGGCVGWIQATFVLIQRGVLNLLRNPTQGLTGLILQFVIGILIGAIFFQMGRGKDTYEGTVLDARNASGVAINIVLQLAFSVFEVIMEFPKERALFNRESANGLYEPSSYYIAHQISRAPLFMFRGMLWFIPYYFITGMGSTFEHFVLTAVITLVGLFTYYTWAIFISTVSPNINIANVVYPLTVIVFALVAGFFLADDAIPVWLAWIRYISEIRYAFFGTMLALMRPGETWGSGDGLIPTEQLLTMFGVSGNYWSYVGMTFGLGCAFHVLAFMSLTFLYRKQGLES